MRLRIAKHIGYCFGVRKAVDAAYRADANTCVLGEIIHNSHVIRHLAERGIRTVDTLEEISTPRVILRSHGVSDAVYERLRARNVEIVDCTCPFVKRIHNIIREYAGQGYEIVIVGKRGHAEVDGLNGCCDGRAIVVSTVADCVAIDFNLPVCVVVQTTFDVTEYQKIVEFIKKQDCKTLVIFDTICYTTIERQTEVADLAQKCDKMLILGSPKSSNTNQLYQISSQRCKYSYLISDVKELSCISFHNDDCVGITSGASTHDELIQEVLQFMSDNNEIQKSTEENFGEMLAQHEQESVVPRVGSTLEAVILSATEDGVVVSLGAKHDGFISKEEAVFEGEYNPAEFVPESKVDVCVIGTKNNDTGLIPVSKKKFDAIKKGNEIVNTIRDGQEFSLVVTDVVSKGLTGHLGNYRVFIPQSHVEERFVKNLAPYKGKTLRLTALEIDDEKHKIVASQKVLLAAEREAKEKEFFDNIAPDVIVIGKVMRVSKFGAFVDVGGFDCLAHIVDLSWTKINSVEDVLTIGQSYEFIVLKVDREKKRVSLGFKQLHLHPFQEVVSKYNVGDIIEGTVVRIKEFGAFVKIAEGVDGLVHISEASHNYVKNINDVLKVGDAVKAMITKIDDENRKISLSIKAATEPPVSGEEDGEIKESRPRAKSDKGGKSHDKNEASNWNEDTSNNPFADLLKDIKAE